MMREVYQWDGQKAIGAFAQSDISTSVRGQDESTYE
jgi:hypothetical protein